MKKYLNTFVVSLFIPVVASAAPLEGVKSIIEATGELTTSLTAVLAGVALLVFIWGLVKFIFRVGGDEKAVGSGKTLMQWGLIALFVMISVWGIVKFMQRQFGLNDSSAPTTDDWFPYRDF